MNPPHDPSDNTSILSFFQKNIDVSYRQLYFLFSVLPPYSEKFPAQATVNHTIVHLTGAVIPLCLFYDFIEQAALSSVLTPSLLFLYKSCTLQIMDCTLDRTYRQVQLSGNGTDCRIACPLPVRTSLQIQIDRHRPVWQLRFIDFFPSHPAS